MDTRWLRRRMVLYHKRCVLLHSVPRAAIRSTHWLLRRAPELRFQEAAALDLARRQLLVWRRHTLNGVRRPDTRQTASRIGGTVSVPITKHQSIKCSYSDGTYIRFGGDYQNLSVGWQYSW